MEPRQFIDKWRASERPERAAAQQHFLDLCALLEVPKPGDPGQNPADYEFEKRAGKSDGRDGRADVWRRRHFAWEYKGPGLSLAKAYAQLKGYADALENPPLLIVSDTREIRLHTNFTNAVKEEWAIPIADLLVPEHRARLRKAWTDPESFRPTKTHERVTREAAAAFAELAQRLRGRNIEPRRVAHFLNKLVFCLFAEDIELLPDRIFAEVLEAAQANADDFEPMLRDLFRAMRERQGRFGHVRIPWFNGGLFDDDDVLPLNAMQIAALASAARLDWSAIEPSIFGTLFERGLDPAKRKQMAGLFEAKDEDAPAPQPGLFDRGRPDKGVGIHYTDEAMIMKIVEPVVLRPLRREWEEAKATVAERRAAKARARSTGAQTKAEEEARDAWRAFRERLGAFRVLDPACGSGNFLFVALRELKDFDLAVMREGEALGLPADGQRVGPEALLGIEINPYAAELARVTVWIGELQWQLKNGFPVKREPILGQLKGIENRDALLKPDGTEASWPAADAVVGNPPFLGDKLMIAQLGQLFVTTLRRTYEGRVPGGADLVCYWIDKARAQIAHGHLARAGLVATNSIRGGANREVLDRVCKNQVIFDAWPDEPWVLDGAAVRVSLVAFRNLDGSRSEEVRLNGRPVPSIHANLTSGAVDLTQARPLHENRSCAFIGTTKKGRFDVAGETARRWLLAPNNPNGRRNSDVVVPWKNGLDVTRRPQDLWVVDFKSQSEEEAALYEAPFKHVDDVVRPARAIVRNPMERRLWWRHARSLTDMRTALARLSRFIGTPRVAKHRLFVWIDARVLPDCQIVAIGREDDAAFGVLHSRFHELWTLRMCTWLGVGNDPRYTPSTTFETFPFPKGLTPNIPAKDYESDPRAKRIAAAARRLNELRENWLNPADLVRREPEVVPGYPDRVLPVNDKAAAILKKRTLTNLYNERPQWLADAHRALDEAVAAAYGWPADLPDDEILARLLALNLERAGKQSS